MGRAVALVGRGFGGPAVAKALDSEADVVHIGPRDAFVNSAGSPRALGRPDWSAGEIKEIWPHKRVTHVDRAEQPQQSIGPRPTP